MNNTMINIEHEKEQAELRTALIYSTLEEIRILGVEVEFTAETSLKDGASSILRGIGYVDKNKSSSAYGIVSATGGKLIDFDINDIRVIWFGRSMSKIMLTFGTEDGKNKE